MKITPDLSAYLDFLRFFAALAVLLGHMNQDGIAVGWMQLSHFSHEAVIVFFVLSGFIIHNNTYAVGVTAKAYAVARISRIYSVALPAVAFAVVMGWMVSIAGTDRLPSNHRPFLWGDVLSSLLFLNESWTNSAQLTMNDPYWSLCYEVWFYVMFGACVFTTGLFRIALVGGSAAIAGPAIIALMPVWLFGAWAAVRYTAGCRLSPTVAAFAFVLAPLLVVGVNQTGADLLIRNWLKDQAPAMWHLGNSQRFATDYVLGLALAIHLWAFSSLPAGLRAWLARRREHLGLLAGFSFTLYLFHRPLTQAIGAYFPQWGQSRWGAMSVAGGIITFCWLVSFLTERQLPWWRQKVRIMFDRVGRESERHRQC